ncbi:MAG: response regulator [Deltaproteobacteria bacterium]|nr:response regulator [Deltaproteobacteria bacterium]MBI2974832.1 response regulator [Deltaproteobacteria bacterium]
MTLMAQMMPLPGSKVLFVDDDAELRSEFKNAFSEYEIIEASSGESALKIIKAPNEIVLAILDVRMPGMNGLDLLKAIRNISPEIGIIIMTGHGSKDVVVDALRGSADDYIEKPFSIKRIKEIIERIIRQKRGEDDPLNNDTRGKIEHVKLFVERNWQKKLSLSEAANAVCLSPKYLSRVFRQHVGVEFGLFKLKTKIDKAKELLSKTGLNVSETAYKLGYENIESFVRIFKKITGAAPSEYKNKYPKNRQLYQDDE